MTGARRVGAYVTAAVVCVSAAARADSLPAWARALRPPTIIPETNGAIVLYDEIVATVLGAGRVRIDRRYAVSVQTIDGRAAASISALYSTNEGGIRALHAWLQKPGGGVRELGSRETVDLALVNNDVYNEARVRTIGAAPLVEPGTLFVAESTVEDRVPFSQLEWLLQDRWPAQLVRRVLVLPDGWRATAITLNGSPIDARVSGSTYTWELPDVPAVADEPLSPPLTAIATRLLVSYFGISPAAGDFASWSDVARWFRLVTSNVESADEAPAAKARALTAGAATEFEKIQAIARFVQSVQYISIQTGIGRGGGYQPRPPRLVFDRNYGDCKDKANLMRAMLAAVGIRSYLVAIFAGDPGYVHAGWYSPQQFNHCIIAITLEAPVESSSIVEHPSLGRLLIFDPTDETTSIGDLPDHEQGSLALIVADGEKDLTRMPQAAAASSLVDRRLQVLLSDNGTLTAVLEQQSTGAAAARERMLLRMRGAAEAERAVREALSAQLNGLQLGAVSISEADHAVLIRTEVSGRNYLQPLQQNLYVLRLPSLMGHDVPALSSAPRHTAVRLRPKVLVETVRLKVAGFSIDELPESARVDGGGIRFQLAVEHQQDEIVISRRLEIDRTDVPPADQRQLKATLTKIRGADSTPVVLRRP